MKIANAWQKYFIDFVQTLTSINPRCSVLKPPIIANWSFISAVIWIFSAANRMIEAILVEWDFRWILWFFFSKQLRKSNISVIIRQFPWKNVMKVRFPPQNIPRIHVKHFTFASRFHSRGCIHRVAKQTIPWHFRTNNSWKNINFV